MAKEPAHIETPASAVARSIRESITSRKSLGNSTKPCLTPRWNLTITPQGGLLLSSSYYYYLIIITLLLSVHNTIQQYNTTIQQCYNVMLNNTTIQQG